MSHQNIVERKLIRLKKGPVVRVWLGDTVFQRTISARELELNKRSKVLSTFI